MRETNKVSKTKSAAFTWLHDRQNVFILRTDWAFWRHLQGTINGIKNNIKTFRLTHLTEMSSIHQWV